MKQKYGRWGLIVFELVLIYSLVRGIQSSIHSRGRVNELETQKQELLEERGELGRRLEYLESEEYLEQVARGELNLAKPGETVVIVPEDSIPVEEDSNLQDNKEKVANWQKWVEVVFGT